MYLNKNTTSYSRIKKPKRSNSIVVGDVTYSEVIINSWSEAELNTINIFKFVEDSIPNRRYYTYDNVVDEDTVVIERIPIDKDVEAVQKLMNIDLAIRATEKEESGIIVGGLEIATDAKSQARLTAGVTFFGRNPQETRRFKHKNGFADATEASMNAIQDELALHIETVTNAEEVIYNEFMAFTTIAECVAYEHFAYDYTITQEDVDNDETGTLVLGEVVTRYKNKVKDW